MIDDHREVLRSRVGGALRSAFLARSGLDALKLLLVARFGKTRRPGRMMFEAVLIPLPACSCSEAKDFWVFKDPNRRTRHGHGASHLSKRHNCHDSRASTPVRAKSAECNAPPTHSRTINHFVRYPDVFCRVQTSPSLIRLMTTCVGRISKMR